MNIHLWKSGRVFVVVQEKSHFKYCTAKPLNEGSHSPTFCHFEAFIRTCLEQLASHTNYLPPVNLLICTCYYTITPLHALDGRLINFSSMCRDFPLNW